jgi:hypothetical protein
MARVAMEALSADPRVPDFAAPNPSYGLLQKYFCGPVLTIFL